MFSQIFLVSVCNGCVSGSMVHGQDAIRFDGVSVYIAVWLRFT